MKVSLPQRGSISVYQAFLHGYMQYFSYICTQTSFCDKMSDKNQLKEEFISTSNWRSQPIRTGRSRLKTHEVDAHIVYTTWKQKR